MILRSYLGKAALFAATGLAVAAMAPTAASAAVTLDFTGSNTETNPGGDNVRKFTFNNAAFTGGTLIVEVTAWTRTAAGGVEQVYVGQYSSYGLGATATPYETGSNNTHTVDNQGTQDFLVFQFSQSVRVTSTYLTPFALTGQTSSTQDSDATAAASWTGDPITNTLNLGNTWAGVASLFGNMQFSAGDNTASAQAVNGAGNTGNLFFLAAGDIAGTSGLDAFKVKSLDVTAAVPEPASWAMMIAGLGVVGMSMRRRKTKVSFA
jgi:hypothetical protein